MFEQFPDDKEYNVVINHEEQYSIWPVSLRIPEGWKPTGKRGTKSEIEKQFSQRNLEKSYSDEIQKEMAEKARSMLRKE